MKNNEKVENNFSNTMKKYFEGKKWQREKKIMEKGKQ